MNSSIIKTVGFVHLHVHSAYSLREGALTIETLAKLAKADDMPALAITDTNNLFGALEFSEKLAKLWRAADHRRADDRRFRRRAALAPRAAASGGGARADRADRAERGRLPQSDASRLRLWLDPKDGDEPHIPFGALDEARASSR